MLLDDLVVTIFIITIFIITSVSKAVNKYITFILEIENIELE